MIFALFVCYTPGLKSIDFGNKENYDHETE